MLKRVCCASAHNRHTYWTLSERKVWKIVQVECIETFVRGGEREVSHNQLAILSYRSVQEKGACGWTYEMSRCRSGGLGHSILPAARKRLIIYTPKDGRQIYIPKFSKYILVYQCTLNP